MTMRPISPGTELRYVYDTPPLTPEPPIAHESAAKLYNNLGCGTKYALEERRPGQPQQQAKWTPEWRDKAHFVLPYTNVRKSE